MWQMKINNLTFHNKQENLLKILSPDPDFLCNIPQVKQIFNNNFFSASGENPIYTNLSRNNFNFGYQLEVNEECESFIGIKSLFILYWINY